MLYKMGLYTYIETMVCTGCPCRSYKDYIKSYICFSICKALYSLIFGYLRPKRTFIVLFMIEKEVSELTDVGTSSRKS